MPKIPAIFHQSGTFARARSRRGGTVPGQMNRTETAYAEHLQIQLLSGQITGWRFESYKLRLADRTWYTPDFVVQCLDGTIELHEVKATGRDGKLLIEDDAAVKIKVAADQYPEFEFLLAGRNTKGWNIKPVRKTT